MIFAGHQNLVIHKYYITPTHCNSLCNQGLFYSAPSCVDITNSVYIFFTLSTPTLPSNGLLMTRDLGSTAFASQVITVCMCALHLPETQRIKYSRSSPPLSKESSHYQNYSKHLDSWSPLNWHLQYFGIYLTGGSPCCVLPALVILL